ICTGSGGLDQPRQAPFAQGATLVWAAVPQRDELAPKVKDADRSSGNLNDLAPARRDLCSGRDHIPGHMSSSGLFEKSLLHQGLVYIGGRRYLVKSAVSSRQ